MDSSNTDLSAVDSAAKLLRDLRLAGTNRPAKHMDSMEVDLLLEVPDTPDRLATVCPAEDVGEDAARETYHQTGSNLGLHCERNSPSNAFDNDRLFREASVASLISKPRDADVYHENKNFLFGISYPTRCRSDRRKMARDLHGENEAGCCNQLKGMASSSSGKIRGACNGIANSMESSHGAHGTERNQGINEITVAGGVPEHCSSSAVTQSNSNSDRISFSSDSQAMTEKASLKPYPRRFERRKLVRHGLISPNNIRGNVPSANDKSFFSCAGRSALDKGKKIDLSRNSQNKNGDTILEPCQFHIPQKNCGQKRLVKNGFISPLNIGKNRNATDCGRDVVDRMDTHEVQDAFLSTRLHDVGPDSEPRQANCRDDAKSSIMSSRELLLPGKGTIISETAFADVQPADDIGWRTMHSHAGKAAQPSSEEISVVSKRNDDYFHSSKQVHERSVFGTDSLEAADPSPFTHESTLSQFEGSSEVNCELNPDNERHYGKERLARGKRKTSSNCTLPGECSSSAFIGSDALHPELCGKSSNAKSTRGHSPRCHGVTLEPVIDLDELPSPVLIGDSDCNRSCISSESVTRAQQVESDEMLARQLQQQFFNESSNFGGSEEIDATIAWTLQQEEEAQHASLVRSRGQSNPRRPTAHLYRQYLGQFSQDSSIRSTGRARITSSARMAQLRRSVRREMDLEMRLNILEALEVAHSSDSDLRSDILHVQRDFNENDYEMLLALDEDNHQHMGASLHQINSLPQSLVQTENVEEACAICLEKPSVGDTIRHLPCLHKFHKGCIDTWLRRRTSCPICKSEIT